MKIVPTVMALALVAVPANALAHGGHPGSHHYGSSHHGGGHVYGFRTGHCKSASCYRKHPNGTYVHPLTTRKA
jgi:hypothetical protein